MPKLMRFNVLFLLLLLNTGVKIFRGEQTAHVNPSSREKKLALTFDDGPSSAPLARIFAILEQEKVKATFFVVGNRVGLFPQQTAEYMKRGHTIANHTYSHQNYYQLRKSKTEDEFNAIVRREIAKGAQAIKNIAGVRPVYLRMPNGFVSSDVRKIAAETGHTIVNWSFGCDWKKLPKEKMIQNYLASIQPGAILLFHEKEITADVLPDIIAGIKKKGYKIVTLEEILSSR